jgi:hypothetical protein
MSKKTLRLSLKKKWFEMTKAGIKKEDYRELNDYWTTRLQRVNGIKLPDNQCKQFEINVMTLGYPSNNDHSRILELEHKGIEIRTGNPEWGAEPGKLCFVIIHGKIS